MIVGMDVKKRLPVAHMPAGTTGHMDFAAIDKMFREANRISLNQTITHLTIDVERGRIAYRVENMGDFE